MYLFSTFIVTPWLANMLLANIYFQIWCAYIYTFLPSSLYKAYCGVPLSSWWCHSQLWWKLFKEGRFQRPLSLYKQDTGFNICTENHVHYQTGSVILACLVSLDMIWYPPSGIIFIITTSWSEDSIRWMQKFEEDNKHHKEVSILFNFLWISKNFSQRAYFKSQANFQYVNYNSILQQFQSRLPRNSQHKIF